MCESIWFKDGSSIGSVEQFESYFKVDSNELKYDYYDTVDKNARLCQINLKNFMQDRQHEFEYDCGEWYEK